MITIGDLMRHCRNYFVRSRIDSTFTIQSGTLSPLDGISAQYVAVQGSSLNDGVYFCDANGMLSNGDDDLELANETFTGTVFLLAPPVRFVALAKEIGAYDAKTPVGAMQSESFGEYSYTKAGGRNGGVMTWQEAFAVSLRPYMRMFPEVSV